MRGMHNTLPKRITLAVVLLAFAAVIGAQTPATPSAPTPAWKSYSYPADGFSAVFPFEPSMQKKNVPTDKGSFELRAYLAQDGQAALFVGVCDYGSAIADRTADQVLDGAQSGAIENVSAHLVSGRVITLGIYHGREFEAENDTMHFSARIYLVGTTLYQTLTAAPLGQPYADTTRFLDSFQLIARVAN
ncbi:MAG: hypothetical protein ACLP7O_09825 [Terracidiphilus sp.]